MFGIAEDIIGLCEVSWRRSCQSSAPRGRPRFSPAFTSARSGYGRWPVLRASWMLRPQRCMLRSSVLRPRVVIAEEFARIPGISRLLIFGSWAARHSGEPGPVPNDIDVLVVGDADRGAVYAAS